MKTNELMIGDWVTFKDCQHENPMLIKIIAIGFQADEENDCLVQIDGDKACDIIEIDDEIVGIPLTAEILEKNGFERSEVFVEWKYENDDVYMIYKPFPYLKIQTEESTVAFPCEYIHELQHALKLCGIEKEITI